MPVARLEALVKAGGVGLSGVQASISTFRRLLSLFKTHFKVRNGMVKTAVAPPEHRPDAPEEPEQRPETADERRARLDRALEASQRLREEQDRRREETRQERLRGLRGVYGERPT